MSKIHLIAFIAVAMSLVSTSILADTGDIHQHVREYEVGMTYSGKSNNPRLLQLSLFGPEELKELQLQDENDYTPNGPAGGVEYFEVYAVGSSYIGWEYVNVSHFSTAYDHGGALLRVAVLQYGYGNGGASLNGSQGDNYLTEYLCGPLYDLHYCSLGESVTGFMEYYAFDGQQGGSFSAYTSSYAFPYGQHTDSINIQ